MEMFLKNKTILITGTARGMGRQMVETFSSYGASIIAHARKSSEDHMQFCNQVSERNKVDIFPVYFDLESQDDIKNAIKSIRGQKKRIDGFVNNAGITYNALFHMSSIEEARRQMEVNYFAPYVLAQYISKMMMRERSGSIVFISSSAALDGNSGKAAYGTSKAALRCLSNVMAEELGVYGIRVNTICPGVTQTDMLKDLPDYAYDIQLRSTFLRKVALPCDIANVAAFLLSDYASYITGQTIRVDGGVTEYEKRKAE